jgi:hypothetical protein
MALKSPLRRMTLLDGLVVFGLFIGALTLFPLAGQLEKGEQVLVQRGGRVIFIAPLAEDRTVALPGPLGETVLAIRNGNARILSSPCANKICMGMGEVGHAGQMLACVPNEILVHIDGESSRDGPEYDLLSH